MNNRLYAVYKRLMLTNFKDICRMKLKGWTKLFHANDKQKRAE